MLIGVGRISNHRVDGNLNDIVVNENDPVAKSVINPNYKSTFVLDFFSLSANVDRIVFL